MSTPGQGSILGSPIIYGRVDYGPTLGQVYRPINQRRIVTVAGNDTIQPFDVIVIYKKLVAATFSVQLPDLRLWMSLPYGGFDLTCKDGSGNASTFPITFLPFGASQTIDGLNTAALAPGFQLTGDNGSIIFSPLADMSGWITL